jgi:hypothetical protein
LEIFAVCDVVLVHFSFKHYLLFYWVYNVWKWKNQIRLFYTSLEFMKACTEKQNLLCQRKIWFVHQPILNGSTKRFICWLDRKICCPNRCVKKLKVRQQTKSVVTIVVSVKATVRSVRKTVFGRLEHKLNYSVAQQILFFGDFLRLGKPKSYFSKHDKLNTSQNQA